MKKIIFVFLIILLTGCYNYSELNDLTIVKCASVDIEDDKYVVSYIISNSKENIILEGKGNTISDAISEMNLMSPKELYIGHMLVYIISEDVAVKGVNDVTDYFFRNSSSKKTFQIIISKGKKAKEILQVISSNYDIPTLNIAKNLTSENSLSSTINTTLLSFTKSINDPGIEPIANGITIEKNIKIEPIAIFKDDKFIKWADEYLSQGITILYNQGNSYKIDANCEDKKVIFNLNNLKIERDFNIDDKVLFNIKIKANTEISEMTCNYDLKNNDDLNKLESILINSLKSILDKTIYEIKESKIDSIGIGNYIYKHDYLNYLRVKDDYLDNLEVNFEIIPNLLIYENSNEGTIKNNE